MNSAANKRGGYQSVKDVSGSKTGGSKSGKKPQPSALMDPKIRKQLAKIKVHRPYFLQLMTLIQVLVVCYEFYFNKGIA